MKRLAGWLLVVALLHACAGDDTPAFGLGTRVIPSTLDFPNTPPTPGAFAVQNAFPGLSFAFPTVLAHAPDGTDRLFVAERAGRIRVFDNDPGAASHGLFLGIAAQVITAGERGLLGLAFDPDYATSGAFYVYYSTTTTTPGANHRTVVSRWQVSAGDPNLADPTSETVLLTFDQPYGNHNGGCLAFGPDGMLYISTGDGGGGGDPQENAQDLTSLLGKILRLRPDGTIPPDNPFVGLGGGVREEIWAFGLRNPWRFSFDRNTGELWLGDVGQGLREEVDIVRRGDNLGWDDFEGTLPYEPPGTPTPNLVAPILDYDRNQGRSITGGVVYRGTDNPSLVGAYVYADYATGRVWALSWDGAQVVGNLQIASITNVTSFGEDQNGELYITTSGGTIYELVETAPGPGGGAVPVLLSDTGIFSDTAGMSAAPGLIEYDVNAPLWSDGAAKRRWIALPGLTRIEFDAGGNWVFPASTVLVKHFEIDTAGGATLRLETRVLVNESGGWQGYTYRWNAQQTDADLLPGADTATFMIDDPAAPGGQRQQTWSFPSRPDCNVCHTNAAGQILGVRTRQLNRDFPYAARVDNQLRVWNHLGLFDVDIGDHGTYEAFPAFGDPLAPVADRARAYLAANCANCHQPSGPTPVAIDLRYGILAAQMNAVSVTPDAGDVGLVNPLIIAPGDKALSTLWERLRVLTTDRMPPLSSSEIHQDGVDAVGQWIDDGAN